MLKNYDYGPATFEIEPRELNIALSFPKTLFYSNDPKDWEENRKQFVKHTGINATQVTFRKLPHSMKRNTYDSACLLIYQDASDKKFYGKRHMNNQKWKMKY